MKCLDNRLYVLEYEEYSDRPNLYYINGDDYSVAIDAGNSSKHNKKFYDELHSLELKDPKYTIISHWHWDHTFGLHNIVGTSISSKKTHEKLIEVSKWIWDKESMDKRIITGEDIVFCNDNIIREYEDLSQIKVVTTDEIIETNKTLDLGGISVELIPMASTHGDDSLFVYIPSLKSLIVEDADCPDYYIDDDYCDLNKLEDMIKFFESIDYKYYYLGHAKVETKEFALNRLKQDLARLKK